MRNTFNSHLFLWGLGVIQPATTEEVIAFLHMIYVDVNQWPHGDELKSLEDSLLKLDYIYPVHKKLRLYSLTSQANNNLDVKIRRQRDKARITLLNVAYDASLTSSGAVVQELDGDSPSLDTRSTTQEARPKRSADTSPLISRTIGRTFWPRVVEQLNLQVGLDYHPSDPFFKYCSFPNLRTIHLASDSQSQEKDMTLSELALCIGVTPRLLTSFIHKPENHYRTFTIGKKDGGDRVISSPRFFLKTIQYWIKSYFLGYLKVHDCCHAFEKGRSIISNAENHVGKNYVANIDIENYFGSITKDHVYQLLINNNFGQNLGSAISRLVTLDDSLPQGAPTSPVISNAFLYDFDEKLFEASCEKKLSYTRYADDITISGDSRESIIEIIQLCSKLLRSFGLRLKDKKTRIASRGGSQRVTGLVVNEKIQPPRVYQRKVRSIFHNANNHPDQYFERLSELQGHLSYLSSFVVLKDSRALRRYKMVIQKIISGK
ncbi:MAG: retron St85 family RNA-directed DNA polymerase [Gammaproteobacteria bacterium]|nr:retron St85 family RNA-directed DNA polymerase [Gammaproteobacteria bacterium]